jgi:hypothetical protein
MLFKGELLISALISLRDWLAEEGIVLIFLFGFFGW